MKIKFLLDTNIISEPVKKIPDPAVMKFLEEEDGNYSICSPVLHELYFGLELLSDSNKKKSLDNYISFIKTSLEIFPYDLESSILHAKERARLEKLGRPAPFVDGQIASIAKKNNLNLVTKNPKDYKLFEKLKIHSF